MTRFRLFIILLIVAGAAGAFFLLRPGGHEPQGEGAAGGERKIAYWLAPMDPNYRRDEPGKSPMGMDLIPVYEDEAGGGAQGPSLKIDPAVVNNIGVKTQEVVREDMARRIETVGAVMIDEEARSDIHVRAEGWIEKLHVEAVGEKVEEGEVLFEFYAPSLVAAQSEFIQALKIGRPALTDAATERLTALGMSADQITDIRRTGKAMRNVAVEAPQSGVVAMLNAREGMYLRPSDMAMRLADLSNVWIIADVFDTEAAWVSAGDRAVMTLPAFPGKRWEGAVDYVYPTAEMKTRTVQVRLRFPNPGDRLRPNMFANVTVEAEPKENVLAVAQSAVIRSSKGDRVILALGEGRFRPAEVRTGMESGGKVEVLAGLEEGERVVVESQFLIDSEASLDSGLLRLAPPQNMETGPMTAGEDPMEGMDMSQADTSDDAGGESMAGMDMEHDDHAAPAAAAVEAQGRVVSMDMDAKSVTIDHGPISELGWPSMVMAFKAPSGINIMSLKPGQPVRFAFRETATGYELDMIEPMPEENEKGDQQ